MSPRSRPNARVGIIGGGQLARMTHQAAIGLDVELIVLAADPGDAALAATGSARIGDPADIGALRELAEDCDVLTFDHERIPTEHLEALEAEGFILRPSAPAKRIAQDKLHARRVLERDGFPVPEFSPVETAGDVEAFAAAWGWPVVLKATRGGYDGRGVEIVDTPEEAAEVLALGGSWMAERVVPIEIEVSQLLARSPDGAIVAYPLTETVQRDGICVETRSPAPVSPVVAQRCLDLGTGICEAIDASGIVAIELFVRADGEVLINELALRPHNSGHFTIEGCETSQFENHLRAVLGWPLGSAELRAPAAVMRNVIGAGEADPVDRVRDALSVPGAHLHLYGKAARDGRKLGHVTALGATLEQATDRARSAALALTPEAIA